MGGLTGIRCLLVFPILATVRGTVKANQVGREGRCGFGNRGHKERCLVCRRTSRESPCVSRRMRRAAFRQISAAVFAASAGVLGGCESDSFLDPSVVGRWEHTPTVVPILERIDVIERDTGEFVDVTPVMPEDLQPEATEYRAGPGDGLVILILDFFEGGASGRFEQFIDQRGFVTIPQVGEVYVNKMSRLEMQQAIAAAVKAAGILEDPLVEVQIPGARQATFSIFGIVDRVGRYVVPGPDYRLLEALTDAGGISPSIEKVYVIRQVALSEEGPSEPPTPRRTGRAAQAPARTPAETEGKSLIDLIEELTAPEERSPSPPSRPVPQAPNSGPKAEPNLESILDSAAEEVPPANPAAQAKSPGASPAFFRRQDEPPIDLVDTNSVPPPAAPAASPAGGVGGRGHWVFLNGEWVQVIRSPKAKREGLPESDDPLKSAPRAGEVVSQRIIEVPVAPLIQGVAQYNLVIRTGDTISVPGPKQGFIYLTGPGVLRPGVYQLPFTGKLTLQRLIASAGGLGPIAIPERVDLTRMIGNDRQATIRLNYRAIVEGTQPDLFLKPDDLINVGTNFWATPLAVLRGGLRASYGFGFLLDRNFGNDVFGAPPLDRGF